MQAIGEYLERYPNSHKKEDLAENLLDLRQRLYDKAYLNAKLYYDIGYYNSAVTALNNAIKRYPDSNHREELDALDGTGIQEYFRFGDPVWQGGHLFYDHWFYDLRDIAANAGTDEDELAQLDAALEGCVIYKAATPSFLSIPITRYSGLSSYLPGNGSDYLDRCYRSLDWNDASGLVQ